jgi:DNA-binding HxlR family transcriptional regulator
MSRTYDQYCPVARALELVGERWTMLVARELLLGPRRFTDHGRTPGVSANVLAGRLKDLEQQGMVARRTLRPGGLGRLRADRPRGRARDCAAAMADWGMTMLDEPRPHDEVAESGSCWASPSPHQPRRRRRHDVPAAHRRRGPARRGPRRQPPATRASRRPGCRRPRGARSLADLPRAARGRPCAVHGTSDDGGRRGSGGVPGVVFGRPAGVT